MWASGAAPGMKFVIVSDLAEPELRVFSDQFRDGVRKL